MNSVIDEFCKHFKMPLGELAEHLNIKQPQINDWKKGRRNIPEKHKEAMYELFNIPFNKRYLLEMDKIDDIIRLEVELIYLKSLNESTEEVAVVKNKLSLEKDLLKIKKYLQTKSEVERKQIINKILI